MFFELHDERKIGLKKLSKADLGLSPSSNQTHIGLSGDLLTFLPDRESESDDSIFIYKNNCDLLTANFDRIRTPDNTFRSPKIRTGTGADDVTVVKIIRSIARKAPSNDYYLLWFGLKSEQLVFLMFEGGSKVFQKISSLNIDLNKRQTIKENDSSFAAISQYLEAIIDETGKDLLRELEVISQVEGVFKKRNTKPKRYDIERAQKIFSEIGRKGEILVSEFLERKKSKGEIIGYIWENQDGESGLPYDFSIEEKDGNVIYLDVKSTNYDLDQKIIFSNQEIDFISNTNHEYQIYRVYEVSSSTPKLFIYNNNKEKIGELSNRINSLKNEIYNEFFKAELQSAKIALVLNKNMFEPIIGAYLLSA